LKADPDRQKRALESAARWYEENGKDYHFDYRIANREQVREYHRRYCAANIEKRRESYRLRRARIRATETDIATEWLADLRAAVTYCELCGVELTNLNQHDYDFADLDHIVPLNMGGKHITSNVRYICHLCNLQRPKDGTDLSESPLEPDQSIV